MSEFSYHYGIKKEVFMKKSLVLLVSLLIGLPTLAVVDNNALSKEQMKYQLKVEKAKQKREIYCIKHPDRCSSPVQQQTFTLGLVQSKIKVGVTQDEVARVLGSPNIVTKDANGKDTWIYDKVASVSSTSESANTAGIAGGGGGLGVGNGSVGGGLGMIGVSHANYKNNSQSNQKTLTVVIKFSQYNKVESFTYHMSNF